MITGVIKILALRARTPTLEHRYDPPVSYWCSNYTSGGGAFAFRTPSGVTPKSLPNAPYKDVDDLVFFVWRPARWANWMFEVESYDRTTSNFTFGKGGNQGARGENTGGDFFVQGVLEELDYPSEFHLDRKNAMLYVFSHINHTHHGKKKKIDQQHTIGTCIITVQEHLPVTVGSFLTSSCL